MCIGIPMQVAESEPGYAVCEGRGERRRVNTALVGPVVLGDWLLVFLGDARERIDAERAAEVNATLDLVLGALQGGVADSPVGFELPSRMSAEELQRLAGGR
jgi:hydrogenase expression/formation protein HypC